jgi:hypothetical protein
MPIPLQVQLFDAFLGTQEGIHSVILPDIFSSSGSKNLFLDKYGRAKKIAGYTAQNATPIFSVGSLPTCVRGLFHYKQQGGGTTVRRELAIFDDGVAHWELLYSTDVGGTWTRLTDAGAASLNRVVDWAQFGDTVYIANGVIAPLTLTGVAVTTAGATQSPIPTAVLSSSAGYLLGTYAYKILSLVSGTRQTGSKASNILSVANGQVNLSWGVDANTAVTGYEIYRTSGTGSVYYFVAYVDGRSTVSFVDNVDDLTVLQNRVMEEHGDPPPVGAYYCESHKQRMWWFRTDAFPTRAWFSDPALPASVLTAENFLDCSDSETVGDVITGALGNYEGQLIIFSERAIWAVSGTGQVIGNLLDWTRIRTNAQTGCVHHRAAVRVPAGSKYTDVTGKFQVTATVTIAYLTPLFDIRLFDGDNDVIISNPIRQTLANASYAVRGKYFALHDTQRSEIAWFFATGAATECTTAVVWNYRHGVWYGRDWAMSAAYEADTATQASFLLGGEPSRTVGGYVYHLWNGTDFNGAPFLTVWHTKTLYGVNDKGQPAISHQKRWRWADLIFETDQTVTLQVDWMPGQSLDSAAPSGSTSIAPAGAELRTVDALRIVTTDGSPIAVSSQSTTARALLKDAQGQYLHDTGLRLRISDNTAAGSWSLEGMNLAYQILPGLERRMPGGMD